MPPSYFPLRWESTGDQWWYASPIDWAAANGLYDLVNQLLHLDTNLLIKLTSLRRIRRLETVWDDEEQFDDVAKCRSHVARRLFQESETKKGYNSLIRAGYGGWFLYTAASAGDVDFVKELLERDPLLVFGEGEYGVTDLLYAAARSKKPEVFRLLLDSSFSPECFPSKGRGDSEDTSVFKREMMSRAIHAVARGGNLEILRELLGDSSDVLVYRDAQGSTVLHTASGRGQVEVVKYLVASHDIITCTDNQGNTALHVAAYRGHLAVIGLLLHECPSLASSTNKYGDTFFHMAVSGFRTPGFQRLDRQIELMDKLVSGKLLDTEPIINVRNNEGRTALHVAIIENIQSNVIELLMTMPSIDFNIHDADGMTPLDLLEQQPRSLSSEILIKQLISAGGKSKGQDLMARTRSAFDSQTRGIGNSPGTSFRIPDAEIYLYMDIDGSSDCDDGVASIESCSCSSEISPYIGSPNLSAYKKSGSVNYAAKQFKNLLWWSRGKERNSPLSEFGGVDDDSSDNHHIPLRQRYSNSSLNNKRTFPTITNLPSSPSTKRNYAPSSPFPRSAMSSPASVHKQKSNSQVDSFNGKSQEMNHKQVSFNKKVMNKYFCFGAQGLAVEESIGTYSTRPTQSFKRVSSLTA